MVLAEKLCGPVRWGKEIGLSATNVEEAHTTTECVLKALVAHAGVTVPNTYDIERLIGLVSVPDPGSPAPTAAVAKKNMH